MANKPKIVVLAFAAAVAVTLPPTAVHADGTRFIPNHNADQRGEHYDTVVANYTRRCVSLDGQFTRLRAHMGPSGALRDASALYDQGVAHCKGGARLQGIDELSEAIRRIGGIPRVEL